MVQKHLKLTLSIFTATNEPRVRAWSVYVITDTILIEKINYFNVIGGIAQVNYSNETCT
jgi:hypothetical protein